MKGHSVAEDAGMAEIDALESRLSAALDRIRGGVGALAEQAQDGARNAALLAEIETRDTRIRDLETALSQPKDTDPKDDALATRIATLEDELAEARAALAAKADAADDAPDDAAGVADPRAAELADARAANAKLAGQVETLTAKLDAAFTQAAAREDDRRIHLEDLDTRLQRLREVNADLRALNGQLRQMVVDGLGEPGLLNSAMAAELEALRADRAAEASEINALLAELRPMIQEPS